MPKKLLLLVLAVGGGLLAVRKAQGQRDEDDLWTEATAAPDLR